MAYNTCTTCGCKKCGCSDNGLISPAPCPTPAGCPTPLTCSEVFDAECVSYTGVDIECLNQVVVATDTNLADALDNIISFFCQYIAAATAGNIVEVCDTNDYLSISSTVDPVTGVTTYTVCFDPTNLPQAIVSGGNGINVTSSSVGNITTYTVDNTDSGSAQNIFKNIAVPSQSTIIADSNNDTLTLAAGSGISITTNAITDTITITNTVSPGSVTLTDAGTGIHESLVNNGTGPALATKGLKAGTGISLSSTGTDITITNSSPFTYQIGEYVPSEGGVIAHRWLSTSSFGVPQSGTIQNYLVLDTNNLSVGPGAQWASSNVLINGTVNYNGYSNTLALISAGAGGGITAGTAAVLCNNSTNNGQNDWYLPSVDELSKIWQNRWDISWGIQTGGGTQLSYGSYWSSTEWNSAIAFTFYFITGNANINNKLDTYIVRAIRRFSI